MAGKIPKDVVKATATGGDKIGPQVPLSETEGQVVGGVLRAPMRPYAPLADISISRGRMSD